MVDTMAILGVAACAKLTADRLVRDLVTYFCETTITSPALRPTTSRPSRKKYRLSRPMKPTLSGLGPRPSSRRHKKKVSRMTDAELEAELDNRRRRRAKERDLYSRVMRSEKLAALESDLADLRKEMGRIDPISSKPVLRQRTPHSVRWQPLPRTHRSLDTSSSSLSVNLPLPPSQPNNTTSANTTSAPPQPPPPGPVDAEDEVLIVDPEKRKREKEERQRRREAKKKEREQSNKRMSLADIIRSAGLDPMKRLKPATKKAADLEKEEYDMQKKAKEERERLREKERIEQEKKNLENMGRRIVEQTSTTSNSITQVAGKSGQPDDQPANSSTSTENNQTKDSAAHDMSAEHKTVSSSTKKASDLNESQVMKREEPSEPTSANLSDKSFNKGVQDITTCPGVEAIGTTGTVTGERNEISESDPKRQTRSTESQNNMSLLIAAKESRSGQRRQEHDKAPSNIPVAGPLDNKIGQSLVQTEGCKDVRGDSENMSPNTSSVGCISQREAEEN